jgi:hypothetical protein
MNTGDWVESCTAVAESHDGTFEVITWRRLGETSPSDTEDEALAAA